MRTVDLTSGPVRRIVAAAVRKFGMTFVLPPPARHCDILRGMVKDFGVPQDVHTEEGFLTSEGQFVGRREAFVIADAAGQVDPATKTFPTGLLFSEDLW